MLVLTLTDKNAIIITIPTGQELRIVLTDEPCRRNRVRLVMSGVPEFKIRREPKTPSTETDHG